MPDRLDEIEQILRKHAPRCACPWEETITELLALFPPTPDRGALVNLLSRYRVSTQSVHNAPYAVAESDNVFIDALMAWASPQREVEKAWCEHSFLQGSEWFFKTTWDSPFMGCVPDRWQFCPICAAPRPGG